MTSALAERTGLTAVTSAIPATAVASAGVSERVVSEEGRTDVTRLLTEILPFFERPLQATITKDDLVHGILGNIRFVGDHDNRQALLIEDLEDAHNLGTCTRIQVTSWLIGEQE